MYDNDNINTCDRQLTHPILLNFLAVEKYAIYDRIVLILFTAKCQDPFLRHSVYGYTDFWLFRLKLGSEYILGAGPGRFWVWSAQ